MQYHFELDGAVERLVSEEKAKLTPSSHFLMQIKTIHISSVGHAVLDFSSTNAAFFSTIAIPLIAGIMKEPAAYMHSEAISEISTDVSPSTVQLSVHAPKDVDNEDIARLCHLIPVAKGGPADHVGSEHDSAHQKPLTAVIRSIVLDGCERVSLEGGRALRAAARRNTYLQLVSVYGCSINPGTELQLARATQANAERMINAARCVNTSDIQSRQTSLPAPSSGSSVSTSLSQPESSLLRDTMQYRPQSMSAKRPNPLMTPFPLLRGMLTR